MLKQHVRTQTKPKRHIIVTGTGRAGTTLMVRILTELGIDTGFSLEVFADIERNAGRAGLEHAFDPASAESLPLVVKSPWLVDSLPEILDKGIINIDVAIVPVRSLKQAASSRVEVSKRHALAGGEPGSAPGGLWKTDDPARQEEVLAVQFYNIVETLQRHEVSTIFPVFPRFATDFDHFDRTVGRYLRRRFWISRKRLHHAWAAQCKPEFITQH